MNKDDGKSNLLYILTHRNQSLRNIKGIKFTKEYKYLGVRVEEGFTFKSARLQIMNKLSTFKKFSLLYKLKLPVMATRIFFFNYLCSKFSYPLSVYGYLKPSYQKIIG